MLKWVLAGSALATPIARALEASAPRRTNGGLPLSNSEKILLNRLVDLIVPASETPGAVEAGVVEFIESMLQHWYRDDEKRAFRQGLQALSQALQTQLQKSPLLAETMRLQQALAQLDRAVFEGKEAEYADAYRQLKQLTVIGYYTSEIGASQELAFRPVPGYFNPCQTITVEERATFFSVLKEMS